MHCQAEFPIQRIAPLVSHWVASVVSAVILLSPFSVVVIAAQPSNGGAHDSAVLENRLLRVVIDTNNGSLTELVDRQTRQNLVGDATKLGPLWELTVAAGDRAFTLRPQMAKRVATRDGPSATPSMHVIWSDFEAVEANECEVDVTVLLENDQPVSRWQLAVTKPAGLAITNVRFPTVYGIRRQPDECLAVPVWMGQLLRQPRSILTAGGKARRWAWPYPGSLSMQCLTWYSATGPGLYVACDDAAAHRKVFALAGSGAGEALLQIDQVPQAHAAGLDRYVLPYHILLGALHGDWITAAQRYRRWATAQRWAQHSRLHTGTVPKWVRDTGLWVWNRGRSPDVLLPAADLQQQIGVPVSVLWHWWHGCAYDIGFPEYLPPREGTDAFRRAVATAHDANIHMLVYMNQRAWGMSTASWATEHAARYAVKGPNGKIRPEVYNIFTGKALASMCLATPFWRNKYAGIAETAVTDLGVDGLYMDQACLQLPCYDAHHGHPIGGGDSWLAGFHALTNDIRRRCADRPSLALAGEGCGEPWLEHLDLMLALQVSRERYSALNDPWEVIPFFQAVYHPYAITFGSYGSLVMPPYDELWPPESAPEQPLALLAKKFSLQFRLEQARAFVWGQQPTLANFTTNLPEQRADELRFVTRLARTRRRAHKYLLTGEFLRPPRFTAPQRLADFSRLSIYAGRQDRLTAYQKRLPLVLAGAWRAADESTGIALANISDTTQTVVLRIDRNVYRLPPRRAAYRIDATGRSPIGRFDSPQQTLTVKLPPCDVCVVELRK